MSILRRSKNIIPVIRLASTSVSVQPTPGIDFDTEENEVVSPKFINRNPRNMERLELAVKDRGWGTVWPTLQYWHRLRFQRSQHHITAFVEHCSGNVVVSASTCEWALKRHLYSTKDAMASENVGRVLAQRCLEAGISYVVLKEIPWVFRSESVQRFRNAMKEGGVVLTEPRRIYK
ncbi:hypothetical protein GDO86_006209 [Hymenochirus boettgeri]|uniref:Large ribosomal subunit protein uL18m n=1 Tax=Hymenochirus boettgeri TaxID=247094 RepID=A0A8T2J9W1_9PIPI|nr:hypothetical protein GDO86_006209 [Hymenochirus boettgeri]